MLLALLLACSADAEPPAAPLPSTVTPAPAPAVPPAAPALAVEELAPGFEYGRYTLPTRSSIGDSTVRFVRVDPTRVRLAVRAASVGDRKIREASRWTVDEPYASARAVAVINTSMFRDDWLMSVGHFVVGGEVQNGRWADQQNALLALDPVDPADHPALVNLGCTDRDSVVKRYRTLVQSIRMVGCDGKNVWAQERRAWSSAIVGTDREGRLLFLHTRSPYTMHDLVEMLLASPLGVTGLHYGEGGPEASLYVRGPDRTETNVGSYETGFEESDRNTQEWQLPNVLVAWVP